MNEKKPLFPTGPGPGAIPDGTELSEKEAEALVSLLRSAYPAPPPGLKSAVLARIRAEKRRRGLRRALVRWGALAACVVLVGAAGIRLLPSFTKNRLAADSSAAEMISETAAESRTTQDRDEAADEAALPEAPAAVEPAFPDADDRSEEGAAGSYVSEEPKEEPEEVPAPKASEAGEADEADEAAGSCAAAEAPQANGGDGTNDAVDADDADGGYAEAGAAAEGEAAAEKAAVSDSSDYYSEPFAEPAPEAYDAAEAAEAAEEPADASGSRESVVSVPKTAESPAPEPEPEEEFSYDGAVSHGAGLIAESEVPQTELSGEDGSLSLKLYTLNPIDQSQSQNDGENMIQNSGSDMIPGTRTDEFPLFGSAGENNGAAFEAGSPELTYFYVRTACAHANAFRNSYHDIPNVLIAKVGPALYGAWAEEAQSEDLCGVNILSFAVRFGLSAEEIYATGDTWYFLDLPEGIPLTEENAAAVEQYYLNGGDPGKMIPRITAYELKTAMIREAGLDAYLRWRGNDTALRGWTAEEGAAALGITGARLAELYDEAAEAVRAEYGSGEIPSLEGILKQ